MPNHQLGRTAKAMVSRRRKLTPGDQPRQFHAAANLKLLRAASFLLGALIIGGGIAAPSSFSAPLNEAIPDGRYEQSCERGYRRGEIFAGEEAIYAEKNFADLGCETISLEILSYGRVSYGPALEKPKGAAAIDFQFTKVTLVPRQTWVAKLYQERKLCGTANWELDKETEITGAACDFYGLGRFTAVPEAGDERYGIYRVERGRELYFGKLRPGRDGTKPELRPRDFDPNPYLRRE
ncbi:MAG: hypothetical protein EOP11_04945 [Proteobacteria bacterium]|nr:MAG: hypothetical protein EOP11_04945 [Pseudomonadota bacterium]